MKSLIRMILIFHAVIWLSACAGNKAPVLVGQIGLATSQSIERVSEGSRQLREAGNMPATVDVNVQGALKAINAKLEPLPEILRSIDRLQIANDSTATLTNRAIAILEEVGQDVSVVIAGVPVGQATQKLLELVRAAQKAIQTTMIEVAKIQGAQ